MNPGAQPWLLSLSSGPSTADWKLARQASPHPVLQLPQALMLPLALSSTCQSVPGPPILTPQLEAQSSPGLAGTPPLPRAPSRLPSAPRPQGSQTYLTPCLNLSSPLRYGPAPPSPFTCLPGLSHIFFLSFPKGLAPSYFKTFTCVCVCVGGCDSHTHTRQHIFSSPSVIAQKSPARGACP